MATTTSSPSTPAGQKSPKPQKDKPDQKYASTLLLPKTEFPLRSDAINREPSFRARSTSELYQWQRENNPGELFVLHDGPPYANGHLHLGHALNKLIKDFVNRHKVLQGFKVDFRPGWDCHGLPIELKALSELKGMDRSTLSPTDIRAVAHATASGAVESQKSEFLSYGIMADWDHPYKTMDKDFETRQLKVFYDMMNKGLIYRANKPVYWSPSSKTALAESELEYKDDHKSRSAWIAFELDQPSEALKALLPTTGHGKVQAVIWTTTPWTLPANRAVAVNPKMSYTLFKSSAHSDDVFLAATDRMEEMLKRFSPVVAKDKEAPAPPVLTPLGQIQGQDLVRSTYHHPLTNETLPFIGADYVTSESGSGLVHTAPGHGMDDYKACVPLGIEAFCPVDNLGNFTAEAGAELEGLNVQTLGTGKVLEMLVTKGTLLQEQVYLHKYPYDWRTKKPVILRATAQWFANVGTIKDAALKAIEPVKIVPESARRRLEGFIHSRSEWCISRQRSWGVPIPVLYNVETEEPLLTEASVNHIIKVIQERGGSDAWWSCTTEELLAPEYRNNGVEYRRGMDTMDVWFDSGTSWTMIEETMPRPHLPFVADVYSEGSDQHRGWFQSSLLTSVALTGKAPFGTLITHGFLLDGQGLKMSKSIGNTVDPAVVIYGGKNLQKDPAYGTDVLRLWAASSEYTKDISMSKTILTQLTESIRKFRNTARFMLGNLNGFKESEEVEYNKLSKLDQFMLSEVYHFGKNVNAGYDEHMFNRVFTQLQYFTSTTLSAFYLDVIKDSLYSDFKDSDERKGIQTVLFHTLNAFTKSIAPLAPHLGEEVYEHYKDCFEVPQPSVFRTGWLHLPEEWNNPTLREEFSVLKQLRSEANQLLEQARTAKVIRSSLEATIEVQLVKNLTKDNSDDGDDDNNNNDDDEDSQLTQVIKSYSNDLKKLFIISDVTVTNNNNNSNNTLESGDDVFVREVLIPRVGACRMVARKAVLHKCPRCWTYISPSEGALCGRCEPVVNALGFKAE